MVCFTVEHTQTFMVARLLVIVFYIVRTGIVMCGFDSIALPEIPQMSLRHICCAASVMLLWIGLSALIFRVCCLMHITSLEGTEMVFK